MVKRARGKKREKLKGGGGGGGREEKREVKGRRERGGWGRGKKRETFEQLAFANACHGFVTYMYHGRN